MPNLTNFQVEGAKREEIRMDVFLAQHCRLKAEKLKFGFETKALSKKSEKGKKQRDKYRKRRTIGDPFTIDGSF